ncbi:hypothetical protein Tco_0484528 [Tanacetum coccineum]
MASHHSKSLYAIKECSTCGSLYTKECCSIGSFEDKILTPVPDSSPRCARCGTPVDGPSCRGCAFLRKKFDEDLLAYCVENGIFKDFQDTSESSDDNTNVVNSVFRAMRFVNQDPVKNLLAEPPTKWTKLFRGEEIDEEYERDCEIRIRKLKQDFNVWGSEVRKKEKAYEDEKYAAACRYMLSVTCDDEDDYIPLAITTDLPIEESENSLKMGDEPLSTILATESDEVIKSSVENLVPIPSEFEGMSDDTSDVPTCDNNCVNVESDLLESLINRDTSIYYSSKIDPILDGVFRTVNLPHIAPNSHREIDAFFEESDTSLSHSDNSLPEFESFSDQTEETRSGSTTTHANYSLPEFESFHFDPSFPRPPPEPPDVEICLHFEPDAPVIDNFNELNDDQRGSEIDFSEDDDSFTFVIRTFLPFLTYPEVSPLSCSTGSEDTIFDPGIST